MTRRESERQPLIDVSTRFDSCMTDGDMLATFSAGFVNRQDCHGAKITFEAWSTSKDGDYDRRSCHGDIFTSYDAMALTV